MRLKSVTTINTLLLIAVCLALGATLWWSERALERPYLLMARYLELSQQFQDRLARNIQDYLGSGDALRHSETMQALETLAQGVDTLPEQFAEQLRPSLEQLASSPAASCWPQESWQAIPRGCCFRPSGNWRAPCSSWTAMPDRATGHRQALIRSPCSQPAAICCA